MATVAKKTTAKKSVKKAGAKKSSPKKPVKKTVTKATKKTPSKKTGLSSSQIKVLTALKGTKIGSRELTREQLSKKTGINGGWAKMFGAATRENGGVQGGGLSGRGLVKITKRQDNRHLTHSITAKGLAALKSVKSK